MHLKMFGLYMLYGVHGKMRKIFREILIKKNLSDILA